MYKSLIGGAIFSQASVIIISMILFFLPNTNDISTSSLEILTVSLQITTLGLICGAYHTKY